MSLSPLFALSFLLLSAAAVFAAADDDASKAYSILEGYNFPVGVLPKGVIGYDLDPSTGRFHVYFNSSCSFSLRGSYQLNYKNTISGYISQNKLTSLTGVTVKILFLWLNIIEVDRRGDQMQFSVGIASASFPIDSFYESPQCGCGFDCNGLGRKIGRNGFLSSV